MQPPMTRLSASWRTASVWLWVLAGLIGQNVLNIAAARPAWGVPLLAWCVAAVFAGLLVSRGHRYAPHFAGATLGAAVVAIVAFTSWVVLDEPKSELAEDMRPIVVVGALMMLGLVITPIVILGANPNPWRSRLPGWYPNPDAHGAVRYWDGARFTEHTWAGAPPIPAPPFSPPPPPLPTLETTLRQEPEPNEPGQRPTDFT